MAKIKVDTTGVESEREAIKPGLYPVRIKEVELTESQKSKEPMLKVLYEIQGGQYDGRVLYDYVMLDNDAMAFRLASFQDALGLKRKGEIDTDKIVGKKLQIRTVVQKSDEYGEQERVRNILPPKGKGKAEDLDDDDDDDDDDEVDYNEMTLEELVEELEAREIDVPKKPKKKALIKLLEENDEEEAESEDDEDDEDEAEDADDGDNEDDDEDEDEEDEDDEDEEDEDYSEMDLAELKKEVKSRKLKVEGKATKKNLIAALEASDEEDEDEDDDDEQDYDEMDLDELKDECKERGLKTAGKKAQLVKRLEKDDNTDDDGEPF